MPPKATSHALTQLPRIQMSSSETLLFHGVWWRYSHSWPSTVQKNKGYLTRFVLCSKHRRTSYLHACSFEQTDALLLGSLQRKLCTKLPPKLALVLPYCYALGCTVRTTIVTCQCTEVSSGVEFRVRGARRVPQPWKVQPVSSHHVTHPQPHAGTHIHNPI